MSTAQRQPARRASIHGLVLLLLLLFVAVPLAADDAVVALEGLDPLLLLEGKEQPGKAEFSADHDGFHYLFASAANRDRFLAAPADFAIQNGGECAAMPGAQGRQDLHAVHESKIYLFGSPGCRANFLSAPKYYLTNQEPLQVAIVLFPGVELLDFAGPGEVFATALSGLAFDVFTVAEKREPVVSQGFVEVMPEYAMEKSPQPDILVIPGGRVGSLFDSPAALAWLRQAAAGAQHVLSVCSAAGVVAELGLLDGQEATTHHGSLEWLQGRYPKVAFRGDRRYVDNGKVITAAGVSAGIDAALHLVGRLAGPQVAANTARYMEYEGSYSAPAREPVGDGVVAAKR